MKKLFMAAAALTLVVAATPDFVSQSQAGPRTRASMATSERGPGSEYCKMAKSQRNAPSWNEYYGCMKTPARHTSARGPAPVRMRVAEGGSERGPGSEYCKMAKSQRNAPSWNEYYGCLR
jgi:hypothetical protein